ncbi:hypothetical protein H9X98_10325 [Aeromonas jandaei]|uniref:hypothetical protein n=1 Tax=Aeromonas jandaei TaxID=650 RepID=UPI001F19EB5D|nr:hypothetical protein [Aeromonas jandaei]MCF7718083.1 hypothetical protein [Aeromonas jandaei]
MKSSIKNSILSSMAIILFSQNAIAKDPVPAEFKINPGSIIVHWHQDAKNTNKENKNIEVRDVYGDMITSTKATLRGSQVIHLPYRTQGVIAIKFGDYSSSYKIPYGLGGGNQR